MRHVVFFQRPGPSGLRRLDVIPVMPPVALADDEIDIVGKLFRIEIIQSPLPVVVAVAEFLGTAVGDADLPDLPAIADRDPRQLPEFGRLARFHVNVSPTEVAQHTVRERVESVGARPRIRDGESPRPVCSGPILIVFAVGLPVDGERPALGEFRRIRGLCQTDPCPSRGGVWRLEILKQKSTAGATTLYGVLIAGRLGQAYGHAFCSLVARASESFHIASAFRPALQ